MAGSGFVEIDVHGMNRFQAKTCIDSALKRAGKDVYRIDIIHGFHSGSALKEMVRRDYRCNPKVKRVELGLNDGMTSLVLRDLY
ncbi:Smr/MutS family protein [Lachnospiraceae bacterium NSJ-143]|nr:Smr/MutS family protein [Lachnospiraceae bacterium NSJ-143]